MVPSARRTDSNGNDGGGGALLDCCVWILHTSLTWLRKGTQQEAEDGEDVRWIHMRRQSEAQQQGGQLLEEPTANQQATTTRTTGTPKPDIVPEQSTQILPSQRDSDFDADLGSDISSHDADDAPHAALPTHPRRNRTTAPPTPAPTVPSVRPVQVGKWILLCNVITRRTAHARRRQGRHYQQTSPATTVGRGSHRWSRSSRTYPSPHRGQMAATATH